MQEQLFAAFPSKDPSNSEVVRYDAEIFGESGTHCRAGFPVLALASSRCCAPVIALQPFISGLTSPVDLQPSRDGTGRLFVVEQGGTIRVIKAGKLLSTPFLNLTASCNRVARRAFLASRSIQPTKPTGVFL